METLAEVTAAHWRAWACEAQRAGWDVAVARRLAFQRWRWRALVPAQRVCRLPALHPPQPWESH